MALSREALEQYNALLNQQISEAVVKAALAQQQNETIETEEMYEEEFVDDELVEIENLKQSLLSEKSEGKSDESSTELKELKEELNYAVQQHGKTYRNSGIVSAVNAVFTAACYACTIPLDSASGSQLSTTLGMVTLGSMVVSGYCFHKKSKYNGMVINVKNAKKSEKNQKVKKIHI